MVHEKELILETLRSLLQKRFKENFKELVLFGSRAKDISHPDSDFDLLIIMSEKPDWKTSREISDICYQIDLQFNVITDSHVLGISELDTLRGKQPIFENALSNGLYA
jgi:DNA polymerase sigma